MKSESEKWLSDMEKQKNARKEKVQCMSGVKGMKWGERKGSTETDHAKRQQLMNGIREGEMILKSGKTITGRKMGADELGAVKRSINNSKRRLGGSK